MNTNNPFISSNYEDEDAVDAIEMAPSDTSQDHQQFMHQRSNH